MSVYKDYQRKKLERLQKQQQEKQKLIQALKKEKWEQSELDAIILAISKYNHQIEKTTGVKNAINKFCIYNINLIDKQTRHHINSALLFADADDILIQKFNIKTSKK